MELNPGCKLTEERRIPENWRVETIGKLIDEQAILEHLDGNHGELYPRSHEFKTHGVPYIGANDFAEGLVRFENCKFLTHERAVQFRKGIARDGDVLFAHNATVGPVALLRTNEPFVILSTTATYFRCNSEKLNNLYLKAALQAEPFVRQYQSVMAQSTRFQVPITTQRKLRLIIPPLPEQNEIATAFSDIDELLRALDRLIAKKRDLKQGAMQQLLTGRNRLPGFGEGKGYQQTEVGLIPEDWKISELTKNAKVIDSLHKTPDFYADGYPMVRVADIKPGNLHLQGTLKVCNAVFEEFTRNYRPKRGNIVLSRVGSYGISSFVETDEPFCLGQNTVVIESWLPSRFLYYALNSEYIREQIEDESYGSGYKSLSLKKIKDLIIAAPPTVNEQGEIATALCDMDAEIAALEQRRDKTRALKQAMMQELLTGRIRLV
jgi:type I restriction enzyme S subunit